MRCSVTWSPPYLARRAGKSSADSDKQRVALAADLARLQEKKKQHAAAVPQDGPPAPGGTAAQKTVLPFAANLRRLVLAFHAMIQSCLNGENHPVRTRITRAPNSPCHTECESLSAKGGVSRCEHAITPWRKADSRKSAIVAADVSRLTLKKTNGPEPPSPRCAGRDRSDLFARIAPQNPPPAPTAVELRSADFSPPPLGTCKSAGSGMNSALQVRRNWLNSPAVGQGSGRAFPQILLSE